MKLKQLWYMLAPNNSVTIDDLVEALQGKIKCLRQFCNSDEFTKGRLCGMEETLKTVLDAKEDGLK